MKFDELWAELKRRRVVRVTVAYAAVVFVVLQIADLSFEPLGLPDWSYRFLLLLSLAGFPISVALAWAFDVSPDGVKPDTGSPGAGSRTMGRVVIGLAVVSAIAVGVWQFSGDPEPVGAEGIDTNLIAVVPFRVSSADDRVTILREGVIDMLAPIFSGSPRVVDSGAMISAWRGYVDDNDTDLSDREAVELARRIGAGRVLVGSIVGDGRSFVLNARLLRVPGGEVLGDAAVDGSSDRLRESVSQLAAQVRSMEAGVDQGQIDYLSDVPLTALEAYLRGRRAFRRTAYVEARENFARALDDDSTFALAALGLREAVMMGLDADRGSLGARAERTLRAHPDRLPPRDRDFVALWLGDGGRRSAVERVRSSGAEMVRRFPDKPEAWYLYGDELFHESWRVGEADWFERAEEAFRRAQALDPGLEIVREHLVFAPVLSADTIGLRDFVEVDAAATSLSETTVLARAVMAYVLGDAEYLAWIRANLDGLTYAQAQMVAMTSQWPGVTMPSQDADRALARMERTAVADADRRQALEQRYYYLRSAGRASQADDALRLLEAAYGPQPDEWVGAFLYWDGLEEPAQAAAEDLTERVDGTSGPLLWEGRAYDACMLELWRLRRGDTARVDGTLRRLLAGSDDPDPTHGRNALCALTLRTIAASRRGTPDADTLLAELVSVLDQGPASVLPWASLEAAWLLEERGDLAAAARVAGYISGTNPLPFAGTTVHREAGRLAEAAGDTEAALHRYRWFLSQRPDADPRLQEEIESLRARVTVLETAPARR